MDYLHRFNNKSILKRIKGFSLIELLIVIGIFFIFAGMSSVTYYSLRSHTNLELTTSGVVQAIHSALSSAQSGKEDSKWGVKISSEKVVVFKGDTFDSRDTTKDQELNFSGVNVGGLSEIVFEKISGKTVNVGTVSIQAGSENKNISINERGTVSY